MKCPHCGLDIIKPSYKFCPSCRKPVNNNTGEPKSYAPQPVPEVEYKSTGEGESKSVFRRRPSEPEAIKPADVEVVKNKVFWNLSVGEVARRINIDEFANLSHVRGVYIQDGVKALLIVDGNKVLEFESGLYYLSGFVDRSVSLVKRVIEFFKGCRRNDSDKDYDMRRNRLDIALQALKGNSVAEVILIADGYIPVVLNVEVQNGNRVFAPYRIPTKISTLEIGVSLHMRVTDYRSFQTNYLGRNRSFRIAELQDLIKNPVGNELKRLFATTDIQGAVFPVEMEGTIRKALKDCINAGLYGIEVMQVVDVTMDNEDFNRFREIEHKLYCTQKELDYLIRTNTFRNRLQDEKNAQQLREARSEEDLRYALQQINKDELLHNEEFDSFVDMLESQRRLREATTQEEEYEAMLRLSKNQLVADDDFAALQNEMEHRQWNRDEVDDILRIQSSRRVESEWIEAAKLLDIQDIRAKQEIEGASHDAAMQKQKHGQEYEGREWEQDERRLGHNIRMEDAALEHQGHVDDRVIERKGKYDDYDHSQRVRTHGQDVVEKRDDIDTSDYRAKKHLEQVKEAQDISLSGMERMEKLKMSSREQEEELKIKAAKAQSEIDLAMAEQTAGHEEEMERIKATILQAQHGMSAEQLAATKLDQMSPEAQIAFAAAFSSSKEHDLYKMANDEKIKLYQEMAGMSERYAQANVAEQKAMMEQMIALMQNAMNTNADIAKSAVAGQSATIGAQFETMRDFAAGRINEVKGMSDEYREEAHRHEDYARHTADSAMHYTTETNRGKSTADAMLSMVGGPRLQSYIVPILGNDELSLETMASLINLGTIQPDTVVIIDGKEIIAKNQRDLRDPILRKYSRKCPNCGREGCMPGEFCPECGTDI